MKVLVLHNRYQQRGGEDAAAEQDVAVLRKHGHSVHFHTVCNDEISSYDTVRKLALWFRTTWSMESYRAIKTVTERFGPDVIHVHNFFPLLSPSVYYAARDSSVPVVQTLHNYRVLAPCALLLRENRVCEKCVSGSIWNSIRYRCYHGSALQTACLAAMIGTHRRLGTWHSMVDRFVALTEFSKRVFERGGLSGSRIAVRPNFLIDDPGVGIEPRSGAVYVGRLSPEKGIECLLEAWRSLSDIPLTIIGDGPMRKWAVGFVQKHSMDQVRMAGAVSLEDVLSVLKRSSLLVFPSVWYETFGRTIIEAYSAGTPVLASDIGAGGSLVEENVTGLHFDPGNPDDLAAKVREMALDADRLRQWGANAREEYLAKYSASSAYESLMRIYERVVL